MTTSTARFEADRLPLPRQTRRGFTVVELLTAMTISSMALAAVISTVTYVARSTISTSDYADMDREARTGLELFARDVRMASDVVAFSEDAVTLRVVTPGGTADVNYTFVPQTKTFFRAYGTGSQRTLITNIENFRLSRYSIAIDPDTGQPEEAANHAETKQIQLELRAVRTGPAKAFASNNVVSARYILRNKNVD